MKVVEKSSAGTLESSDIMIFIEPLEQKGIEIDLTSTVIKQFGQQIKTVIQDTLCDLKIESAYVKAIDNGALDCVIKSRVKTAAYRAAKVTDYLWE